MRVKFKSLLNITPKMCAYYSKAGIIQERVLITPVQYSVPKLLQIFVRVLLIALRLLRFNARPFSPLFSLELNSAHIAFLTTCSQGEKVILLKITFGKRKGEIFFFASRKH